MVPREAVVAAAKDWIGTPWLHQASLKGVGTDCIGLLVGVAFELGLADARREVRNPVYNGYGREPDPKVLLAACDEYLDAIPALSVDCGDVLLMRFNREPQHFAIVSTLHPMHIIHGYAQARKVVENIVDDVWRSRIVGAYRFRGVA